jgi:hypothetical protein
MSYGAEGLKSQKDLYQGLLPEDDRFFELNRKRLRCVVVLFTGHCHLKRHLFKLGLTDDPIYERCLEG